MVSCVCSGYIPHHKCCSVYVISRVKIAFHITLTPHQIKRFHITYHYITPKDFTHHLSRHTIPHHTIAQHSISHYYIPHVPCHISQTFNVATHLTSDHHILHLRSHYTAVCLGTTISHHHISTEAHAVPHHTDSPHLTRVAIPYPQLFATPHPHSTSQHISHHHIPHRITPHQIPYRITPPHLTSQHIASFSTYMTYDITLQSHSTLHITIPHHHWLSTFCNMATFPHTRTPHSTRHSPHTLHFNKSHHVWNCNIQHRTTFHIHWRHFAPNRSTTSRHTIPHHAMHTSPHSDINYTSHCPKPHHTSHTAFQLSFYITAMSNKPLRPHHSVYSTTRFCITAHHHSRSHHVSQHHLCDTAWPHM